jgi:hypothetical protein
MVSQSNVIKQPVQDFEHLEFYHSLRQRHVSYCYVMVNFNVRFHCKPGKCNTCHKMNEDTVQRDYKSIVKLFYV